MKQRTEIFRRRAGFVLVALIGLCVAPSNGHGSVVRALDLDQQIGLSDLVVEGRVGISHQNIDPISRRPLTDTPIHIIEVLRGGYASDVNGGILRIRQIRGQIGGQWVSVVGDPVLKPGDHVILLLRHVGGRYYLTALAQSVFWVDGSVTPRVEQRLDGLMRVTELGGGRVRAKDAPVMTLAELRDAIRIAEGNR